MAPFIYISGKWIPLSRVKEAEIDNKGRTTLVTLEGERCDIGGNSLNDTIVSIVAAPPGWELIEVLEGETEGTLTVSATPVMAFGLNAVGTTVPITPCYPDGAEGSYALRAPGDQKVLSAYGVYESAQAWLEATTKGT